MELYCGSNKFIWRYINCGFGNFCYPVFSDIRIPFIEPIHFLQYYIAQRAQTELNLVTLQRTIKKYTKIYNAGAQLWVCSLRLLLGDILVVIVVVQLSSLLLGAYENKSRASDCPVCFASLGFSSHALRAYCLGSIFLEPLR